MDIQELREWDELFSTKAWAKLVSQAQVELDNLASLALGGAKEYAEVTYLRGQATQLEALINLEDAILNLAKAEAEENEELLDASVPV